MPVREKVEKSRDTVCFPLFCGSGGSKSMLAKAAGAGPSGQMWDEKLHATVARRRFGSKNDQSTSQPRSTFERWDVEKVHAVAGTSDSAPCQG